MLKIGNNYIKTGQQEVRTWTAPSLNNVKKRLELNKAEIVNNK